MEDHLVVHAGMAELADARDLKSREIFSRTGSTPASGTIYIAEWSSLAARRAHNPKVMRFKSHLRNQRNSEHYGVPSFFFRSAKALRVLRCASCSLTRHFFVQEISRDSPVNCR